MKVKRKLQFVFFLFFVIKNNQTTKEVVNNMYTFILAQFYVIFVADQGDFDHQLQCWNTYYRAVAVIAVTMIPSQSSHQWYGRPQPWPMSWTYEKNYAHLLHGQQRDVVAMSCLEVRWSEEYIITLYRQTNLKQYALISWSRAKNIF